MSTAQRPGAISPVAIVVIAATLISGVLLTSTGREATLAHSVTESLSPVAADPDNRGWPWNQNEVLSGKWSATAPPPSTWMQVAILLGAGDWQGVGARDAQITIPGSGIGTIHYRAAGSDGYLCPAGGSSIACEVNKDNDDDGRTDKWTVTFTAEDSVLPAFTVSWCDSPSPRSRCWDVEHWALHEFGHLEDLGHSDDCNQNASVMTSGTSHACVPSIGDTPGWNYHTPRKCDIGGIQLIYDVTSTFDEYGDCFDDFAGGGANGLLTEVTSTGSSTTVCYGVPVTFQGVANVQDIGKYRVLGGNLLGGRPIHLDWRPHTGGTWTSLGIDDTNSSGAWAKTFAVDFGDPTPNRDFRARLAGSNGLNGSVSGSGDIRNVHWVACGS